MVENLLEQKKVLKSNVEDRHDRTASGTRAEERSNGETKVVIESGEVASCGWSDENVPCRFKQAPPGLEASQSILASAHHRFCWELLRNWENRESLRQGPRVPWPTEDIPHAASTASVVSRTGPCTTADLTSSPRQWRKEGQGSLSVAPRHMQTLKKLGAICKSVAAGELNDWAIDLGNQFSRERRRKRGLAMQYVLIGCVALLQIDGQLRHSSIEQAPQ